MRAQGERNETKRINAAVDIVDIVDSDVIQYVELLLILL